MIKYSIIVPVYNAEKTIEKCLTSLVNQNRNDYEVLIINDGSVDKSEEKIKHFIKDYTMFKYYQSENKGVSSARNFCITKAAGDYLLFVDSDDYLEDDMLEVLDKIIDEEMDLIRFQYSIIKKDGVIKMQDSIPLDRKYSGPELFKKLAFQNQPFDMPCTYVYKRSFWLQNNFKFEEGYYHEDFGLIPQVILKANSVYCTSYNGYNYVQIDASITRQNDYHKTLKRVYDTLYHFDKLYKFINDIDVDKDTKTIFNSYISNALISKINFLHKNDRKKYIKELKMRNVFNLLLGTDIKHKLKKFYYKLKYFIF